MKLPYEEWNDELSGKRGPFGFSHMVISAVVLAGFVCVVLGLLGVMG